MSSQALHDTMPSAADDAPLVFAEDELEEQEAAAPSPQKAWKILVADDDEEVHAITQMVLRGLVFEGRSLQLISARSGAETLEQMVTHPDTAVLLLDVVMETDNAGLDVARRIRETLLNRFVRIILRTGQPGQAPERKVIVDYDINDYKEKTELTAQKLVTTVIAALRAYRDIVTIERSRRGLEQIIDASRNLFEPQSLGKLSSGVLQQLAAFFHLGEDSVLAQASGLAAKHDAEDSPGNYLVLAGTGRFAAAVGCPLGQTLSPEELTRLEGNRPRGLGLDDGSFVGHFPTSGGADNFVYLETQQRDEPLDTNLLRLFSANIGVAFDNVYLQEELAATQSELVHTLCEVIETRSNETGLHVFRVGELSRLMGEVIGMDERECQLLRLTAPMHDLGKIGIVDSILHKPGELSPDELEIMHSHAEIGYRLLHRSRRPALQAAAIIARQHHEHWDGNGYPQRLAGEAIHPFGRIVALIDVFDALTHARCYKPAWEMDQALDYIGEARGKQLDPALVDAFLAHRDRFIELLTRYPNPHAADS